MDTRIVLAYNKKHNEDPSVAPWILKHKGETFYVWKVTSSVGFETKHVPDNPHTKGSIQARGILKLIPGVVPGSFHAEIKEVATPT